MLGKAGPGLTAILTALTVIVMTVAVVIMVSGGENAAILVAMVTPIIATILSVAKLSNVQQEMGQQTEKLDTLQTEVAELGNGKMTETVKNAVAEVIAPIIPEGGNQDGR